MHHRAVCTLLFQHLVLLLQWNTVKLLNVALIGCILSLIALLVISYTRYPTLAPHVLFALALAGFLYLLINW